MARTDSSLYEYMYAIYIYLFILNSEQSILFQRPDFWCLLRYLSETVTIFCFPRNIGAVEALAKSQLNILTFVGHQPPNNAPTKANPNATPAPAKTYDPRPIGC